VDELDVLYRQVIENDDLDALFSLLERAGSAELQELFHESIADGHTNAMFYLALLFLVGSDRPEAERWLRASIELDPENVQAMLLLAWLISSGGTRTPRSSC